ncbi:hypothetical protein [Roseisolibacter agri]|uniref:Uncharacterized protein n=1 Tax=Roseisolibacter agri TaxID=2014610 RepID=A0AA37QGW9_9BACT|nr:hypothetical protein [Roseisolibacter agri]GLC26190.1 hypothetical protein rosag_27030 [Roseisolibacter agri]
MAGPIGRTGVVGGVAPVRDPERDGVREGGRTRTRDGAARPGHEAADQVTISPDALRGLRGGAGDDADATGGDATSEGGDMTTEGASGFRNVGEALLVARGLANALRDDAPRAALVHDLVSPQRAIALLRS